MQPHIGDKPFVFPKSTRFVLPLLLGGLTVVPLYLMALIGYGAGPATTTVGYQPAQPLPFSHDLHAGQLGMDCRYCHTTVDKAAMAAVPPTQTCWNCHNTVTGIRRDNATLQPVLRSHATGMPIEWIKVHDLADYVYFNHSRHVNSGVSCVECHGRIDRMAVEPGSTRGVYQAKPLSMAWCIECHRNPDAKIRPPDQVYNLAWGQNLSEEEKAAKGREIRKERKINPSTDCSTCHR
jgi:menaquinone reductase, multiheme cytochrome c subunit